MNNTRPPALPADYLARVCGVSVRTARRWLQLGAMPATARAYFDVLGAGDLGGIAPAWTGWKLHREKLWTPDGWALTRGELLAVPIQYQRIEAMEAERQRISRGAHMAHIADRR